MQPPDCDLPRPAAKDIGIMHPATAPSNLDPVRTLRSAEAESQNTKALRATASEIAAPRPDRGAKV